MLPDTADRVLHVCPGLRTPVFHNGVRATSRLADPIRRSSSPPAARNSPRATN